MSVGLIALLDDIAGLAKVAAASLDDIAAQSAKAGTKAVGVVIDDAAVTPRYVVGFAAARELPIVGRIALGSLKNKLLFLLPAALLLSAFAPWLITPLLMLGGVYLCYEGAAKLVQAIRPAAHAEAAPVVTAADAPALEEQKIKGAIKTDFILSAEIMALTLAGLTANSVAVQAVILAVVGIGLTVLVYGGVALIVKADDVGVALAANPRPARTLLGLRGRPGPGDATPASGADRALRPVTQAIGRGLVVGMPVFLKLLAVVGTAAMLWVGGGIMLHGAEELGWTWPAHRVHDAAAFTSNGVLSWLTTAGLSGVVGLVVGLAVMPVASRVLPH
jgi:predicted DNA repair protein MutK